jgi:hypothetical protein
MDAFLLQKAVLQVLVVKQATFHKLLLLVLEPLQAAQIHQLALVMLLRR